jgi:hypothetical protein
MKCNKRGLIMFKNRILWIALFMALSGPGWAGNQRALLQLESEANTASQAVQASSPRQAQALASSGIDGAGPAASPDAEFSGGAKDEDAQERALRRQAFGAVDRFVNSPVPAPPRPAQLPAERGRNWTKVLGGMVLTAGGVLGLVHPAAMAVELGVAATGAAMLGLARWYESMDGRDAMMFNRGSRLMVAALLLGAGAALAATSPLVAGITALGAVGLGVACIWGGLRK